jgi:type II secretory pathway pseudopilin PulG
MMGHKNRAERGFALVVALLALAVMGVIVAGAIVFTGTERSAAVLQTKDEQLSACAQAAKNMFLSRIRVLQGNTGSVGLDEVFKDYNGERRLRSGHYTPPDPLAPPNPEIVDVEVVEGVNAGAGAGGDGDVSNRIPYRGSLGSDPGGGAGGAVGSVRATAYRVSVLCQQGAGGPERELEFVVQVGI